MFRYAGIQMAPFTAGAMPGILSAGRPVISAVLAAGVAVRTAQLIILDGVKHCGILDY